MFFVAIFTTLLTATPSNAGDIVSILERLSISTEGIEFPHCALTKEFLSTANSVYGCERVIQQYPICNKSLVVAYSELEPLVYRNTSGEVVGILPDILQETLIKRCCLGCNKLEFLPPKDFMKKFTDQLVSDNNTIHKADIIIPAEHIDGKREIVLSHHFSKLTKFESIYFIAKTKSTGTKELVYTLFTSALKSWPLFVIALIMAVCAGTIIWLSDMWKNKEQFPRGFPQGPFEGFWWAYVSMTTVGYGDRTPSTIFGRLFAVVWILIGITIFNMFTATITSALNKELLDRITYSPQDKDIGMIANLKVVENAILKNYATPKAFDNMEKLLEALKTESINAIAIDDIAYKKYYPTIRPPFAVQLELPVNGYSIGFACNNITLKKMQDTFNRNSMEILRLPTNTKPIDFQSQLHVPNDMPEITKVFSIKNKIFVVTIGTVIGISVLGVIAGILANRCNKKSKSHKKKNKDRIELVAQD
ncbi:uncharacterized protein [Clytia hemisphaerica]|uniref:Potassium channel domain-containing protein n=1 Tax=Clytia hemisphaerica TaxID=252671 RepID=A0A7M5WUM8_9CNID